MEWVQVARLAMRVRFEIALVGDDPLALRAAGEEALEEIGAVEALLNPYEASSDIARVNAGAAQGPVRVLPTTLDFLERAAALSVATEGAFDPSWDSAPGAVGMGGVALDRTEGTVSFQIEGLRLDPGALGKGWALDRARAILEECGVERALLHGGTSSVVGIGAPPGVAAWRVALEDGRELGLCGSALSVSGTRQRQHVADPRRGESVVAGRLAAAVCTNATDAEALSTALLVLGDDETRRAAIAARLGAHWVYYAASESSPPLSASSSSDAPAGPSGPAPRG